MKHPIFAVIATATFVAGVIVGHYAMPRSVRHSATTLSAANEIPTRSSKRTTPFYLRLRRRAVARSLALLSEVRHGGFSAKIATTNKRR